MLSSASHHKRLVCELYVDNEFVLLVSNEDGEFEVEIAPTAAFSLPLDQFERAIQTCVERLRDA